MTHSLHRQGTVSSLSDDFVVLLSPSWGLADRESRMKKFHDIGSRYGPANLPDVNARYSLRHLVYDKQEKVVNLLRDLIVADMGSSVIVSGLRDRIRECCREVGLIPSAVNQSLGLWGNTRVLADFRILELTTMCGHQRIPPGLVWELAGQVQAHSTSAAEAARKLGQLCHCNIFNQVRAARLLGKLVIDLDARTIVMPPQASREIVSEKDSGVTIDQAKCIQCLDCIPYCPAMAISQSPGGRAVSIDADRCTECGLCLQSSVCPVDAIEGEDLSWPRSLRGKYQSRYAPYRSSPTLAPDPKPVPFRRTVEEQQVFRHELPDLNAHSSEGMVPQGQALIVAEMGRPHVGTTFRDVQTVIRALIPRGLRLDLQYPVGDERSSLADVATSVVDGTLRREILDERAGWVWLRLMAEEHDVQDVLRSLSQAANEIDSIFAVDVVSRVAEDGTSVADRAATRAGFPPAANCKTNVGMENPDPDD
jgi:Pyruvate/2-oxoacid:ferredoxin oxidoreductase delta subunit